MDIAEGVKRLLNGDFSALQAVVCGPQLVEWIERGAFDGEPKALAEALSCAAFNGCTAAVEFLLDRGVDPATGNATGLDALHWAANRGQLDAVRLLIRRGAPLETRSMYDATPLGTAIWSAMNEPRPRHLEIIDELLKAGARVEAAGYPTGREEIDAVLRRHGAALSS